MKCLAVKAGERIICEMCERPFPLTDSDLDAIGGDLSKVHRRCVHPDAWISELRTASPLPLGDWTAAGLESVGLTKERWNAWKGEVGPCQTCVDRQKWWNELGRKAAEFLGLSTPAENPEPLPLVAPADSTAHKPES